MRTGMICRFDNSGLATMCREYARHLKPDKILLVENGIFKTFPDRFKEFETRRVGVADSISLSDMEWLCSDIDILISFETFYTWEIIGVARAKGVKSILVTMFEMTPQHMPAMPDVLLCPSKLDYDVFKSYPTRVEYLPVPVATDRLVWKKRSVAKHFIHTASHGGMNGRKGTALLIEAMRHVMSDIRLTIYSWSPFPISDSRITVKIQNFKNYWQCWREGDVLVYPQGANGICLPIIEAMTSGMAVITTDIYPFNEFMPKPLLFAPRSSFRTRMANSLLEVEDYVLDPRSIAEKIDYIANQDIEDYSLYGKNWGTINSWRVLLPQYRRLFDDIGR